MKEDSEKVPTLLTDYILKGNTSYSDKALYENISCFSHSYNLLPHSAGQHSRSSDDDRVFSDQNIQFRLHSLDSGTEQAHGLLGYNKSWHVEFWPHFIIPTHY